ncbi:MDR family MFS transporter [Clostridium thermarum]|uniref:MDR family MFS transporter n=1 Tax=Clostridium thermarum TaxID=1716543 RepID=UPI00111DA2B6|nr:MFS transporter [Clostridium thermarum]
MKTILDKFNFFKTYRGLPRSMYVLFIAQIINRFGDFVMPFLTLYLTVKIGLEPILVGAIVTICSIIGIPASFLGGYFADKFGRKKTYLYAQGLAALILLPCAFVKDPYINVTCLMLSSFFHGFIRPAMNAIVTDVLPPEKRQAGFALQYLGINLGVALGPLVAGFLFNNLLPMLFIGDVITSFIALYLVAANIKETHPTYTKEVVYSQAEKEEKKNIFVALAKRPQLALFFLVYIAYSFIYTQHRFALPLTVTDIFGDAGAQRFSYLMSVNAVTVLGFTVIITGLTSKLHPLVNMALAGITYAVGFGMLGYVDSLLMLVLSTVIWTIGEILVMTSFGVYVANNSPSNYRATFSAFGNLSWSIGGALGTSLAGMYVDSYGLKALWNLTIIISLVATVLMFWLREWRKWGTVRN